MGNFGDSMRIFLHRHKQTKKHTGYTTATFPAEMKGNFETLMKDVPDEDYEKIQNGWEVEWNGDIIGKIIEPQALKDEKAKQEKKRLLKEKIKNKVATLNEIMEFLSE